MEIWDLYTQDRGKTGETVCRGAKIPDGRFHLQVHVCIFNGKGQMLIQLGIILFSFAVLFQLVTLPVEFNASGRALRILENTGILGSDELRSTGKVLRAAALTYVASAAAIILQLLRLLILFGGRSSDD